MAILIIFLLGVGNFALHRAVLESGHPLLGQIPWLTGAHESRASFAIEFVLLTAALVFASEGSFGGPVAYVVYSVLNSFSAWLILTDRV